MQELDEARELIATLRMVGRAQLRGARSLLQIAAAADRRLARVEHRLAEATEPEEAQTHEHEHSHA